MTPTRTFRLSESDVALLERLATHEGVSATDVIRIALREMARRRKVAPKTPQPRDP